MDTKKIDVILNNIVEMESNKAKEYLEKESKRIKDNLINKKNSYIDNKNKQKEEEIAKAEEKFIRQMTKAKQGKKHPIFQKRLIESIKNEYTSTIKGIEIKYK